MQMSVSVQVDSRTVLNNEHALSLTSTPHAEAAPSPADLASMKVTISGHVTFVRGSYTGMTATVTCFPLDLVRTRLLSSTAYSNAFSALRDIACKEGIGALYVGCLPAVIGMAPAGAVFYGSYDLLKHNHLSRTHQV